MLQAGLDRALAQRGWLQAVICATIGGVAALGLAPFGLWPLTVLALGWLFAILRKTRSGKHALGLAWAAGAGYFAVSLMWLVEPFLVDVARHGWLAPIALSAACLYFGFYWAVMGWITHHARGQALGFIAAFVVTEFARGYFFTGFPWAQIGHVWIDTPVLHWSSIAGSLGLTALVALAAVGVTFMVERHWRRGCAILSIPVALFVAGILATPEFPPTDAAPMIRLVHPSEPQQERWDPDKIPGNFQRKLDFTAGDGAVSADLIVWPETSVPTLLSRAEPWFDAMTEAAAGTPVVAGLQRFDGDDFYNSLIRLDGEGEVDAVYDKHHLVPFGEFVPFGETLAKFGIFGLADTTGGGYAAGPGPQILDFGPLGRALPLICYEGVFPRDVRYDTRPDFLLLITNDAWFGEFSGPYQHLDQARLRSAEQGLPMIRVANTGVTAMIDATGQVTHQLGLGEAGWIDAPLPPARPITIYARLGDLPIAALFLVILTLYALRARKSGS
ncbi:MAG: apolipoprotein N-acyltransferase [Pseudomonadota bacterium]